MNLNLSHNHIGDVGARVLAPAIGKNNLPTFTDINWLIKFYEDIMLQRLMRVLHLLIWAGTKFVHQVALRYVQL